jgi:xeroderma pigmentosum group C-complementing protein
MLDRDQLEDAELTAKEASEGMPRNVQDFKNHPLYALERHLKRNEIIHPKQESGRINVGTVNHPKFESVYRRSNVHVVKSADKWFRLGREIRIGEQPLKHAIPRRGTRVRESPLDPETVEDVGVGLYAVFQTQVYLPPPVVDGKVPKNQYGNIDIFVPSMIPEGGVWIRMPEAKHAAKLLKVDYADAVTGFDFKGRHGTARIDGVVVAEEHHEAIEIVCDALKDAAQEEKEDGRRREALKLWRKFLVGMREVRRIEGYLRDNGGDTETVHGDEEGIQQNKSADGGFDNAASSKLTRRHFFDDGGGFLAEEDYRDGGDVGGGFFAESDDGDDESDGFVPEEETVTEEDFNDGDSDGGGFVPEKDESKEVAEAVEDSEEVPAIEGTSEASAEDAGPFGFANIRIPAQSRSILNVEDSRMPSLPRVIKGMRRSSHVKAVQEQSMLIEDDVTPTHSRIDKAIADLATARDTEPSIPADSKHSVTESTGACVPEQQAQKESSNSWLGPETTVPTETETNKMTEQDAKPALHQQEEPPPSSYEYDEDMPLDDPEDEDAEPEWLV